MSQIEAYEGNDLKVFVDVTGITSLSGYTPTFTVKTSKASSTALFAVTGTVSSLRITFNVTEAQNSIDFDVYYYEVTITNGTQVYTLAQDIYKVKESLVFHVTGT